jgi:dihydrofolate reductase
MGKLVVSEFITLDGVIDDPGGADKTQYGGWSFKFNRGPEGDKFKLDELSAADAFLLGRITYQGFAAAWPSRKDDGGYADRMNGLPKHVVSTTLDRADWNNSSVIKDYVVDQVSKLRNKYGGDILVYGSAKLVQTLIQNNLVDEYRLMVFPTVLGAGKRLFQDGSQVDALRLVESKPVSSGVVILTYQPARPQ